MANILDRSRPKVSVLDFSLNEIVNLIREKLPLKEIEQAYLFGSVITEQASAWSDIDLLIVMRTEQPFLERSRNFIDLVDFGIPIDIIVYTPDEFARLKDSDSGFWKSFLNNHLQLIQPTAKAQPRGKAKK